MRQYFQFYLKNLCVIKRIGSQSRMIELLHMIEMEKTCILTVPQVGQCQKYKIIIYYYLILKKEI